MSGTPTETILVQGHTYQLWQSPYSLFWDDEPSEEEAQVFLATEQLDMHSELKVDHVQKLVYSNSPILITYCDVSYSRSVLELNTVDNDKPLYMVTGSGNLRFAFIINENDQTMRFKGIIKLKLY